MRASKEEWLINPCSHCPYFTIPCPESHTKKYKIRRGDKIQTGLPLQGGEHLWGYNQTILWIGSDGTPYYRAKWGKIEKPAYCFRMPENKP